jgi:hypothetical protein
VLFSPDLFSSLGCASARKLRHKKLLKLKIESFFLKREIYFRRKHQFNTIYYF